MLTLILVLSFYQTEVVGRDCITKSDCSQGEVCLITEPNSTHGVCVKIR